MRMWFESECYNCGARNLIDNGDTSDLTVGDVEGFVCYQCKSNNAFDEDGEAYETDEEQIDEGHPAP